MAVSITALDGNLNPLGQFQFEKIDIITTYNQVGSWVLTLPPTLQNAILADTADLCISVNWNGIFTFGGYLETWEPIRTVDDTSGQVTDTIVLTGADYLGLVANRFAWPAPALVWTSQTAIAADTQTAVACETAIKHFVNVNAGPGALAARRIPHLTVATDLTRGGTVTYSAKFTLGTDLPLMDIVRTLVATGGPLGVQVGQIGSGLVFDCYAPRDLSKTAWFSYELGNLRSHDLAVTTPTVTAALVRGQTAYIQVDAAGTADAWQYAELLVDQSGSTLAADLATAAADALATGAGVATLKITTIDLPRLTFGTDYSIGDTVTIEIQPGAVYTDILSQVELIADSTGQDYVETVTATVGPLADAGVTDVTATAKLAAKLRNLERQIKRLQLG